MKFLHFNKSIDDFKKLYLFPLSEGWTGSRIPLINEKIDFLIQLKDKLSGIEYIEHKFYIEEYINNMEKEKEEVELREYIENAIYS